MQNPVNEKISEFKGKKFRIRKFDLFTGGYIVQKLLTMLLPSFIEAKMNINRPQQPTKEMSFNEYKELMTECLKVCTCLPHGNILIETPILNDNGSVAVPDFSFDDSLLLGLEVLAFNISGFFTPENMEQFKKIVETATQGFKSLSQKSS